MRWHIVNPSTIEWDAASDPDIPHTDTLEMSGLQTSLIMDYGVTKERTLSLKWSIVWSALRVQPNDTHSSFQMVMPDELLPKIMLNRNVLKEQLQRARFNGILEIRTLAEPEVVSCRRSGIQPLSDDFSVMFYFCGGGTAVSAVQSC